MRLFILTILFAAGIFSCSTNKTTVVNESAPVEESITTEAEAPADSVEVTPADSVEVTESETVVE